MFNRLKEYLELVPKGLQNPGNVAEGVMNALLYEAGRLPQDERQVIEERRKKCGACPYMSSNAARDPAINYKTSRTDDHCILCSCPIKTKSASLSSDCGAVVHNAKFPQNPLEVRWTKYHKPS